jgi:hypothetical protein
MAKDIKYVIRANTDEELQEKIENYKQAYPPLGYDTRILSKAREDSGVYVATMSRYNSCD